MNPYDVFPRRDLPFEAEPWGREVEERVIGLENAVLSSDQSITGENRTSAASLGVLARQLSTLSVVVEDVQELFNALPKAFQRTNRSDGFSLSSGWNSVVSVSFTAPRSGTATVSANATGMQVRAIGAEAYRVTARLSLNGTLSPVIPGAPSVVDDTLRSNYMLSHGWTVPVSEGQTLTVTLQLTPDSGTWSANSDNYAVISAFATFSG